MKSTISRFPALGLASAALLAILNPQPSPVFAQGTAFTYQGSLTSGANAANGLYDFSFAVYGSEDQPGTPIAGPITNTATAVSNGRFTVTLDFGPGVFAGSNYWLEIAVRTNGGSAFTTLVPRQAVMPAPYSIYSASAGNAAIANSARAVPATNVIGALALSQLPGGLLTNGATSAMLSGTFAGNGAGLTNVNLMGLDSAGALNWTTNARATWWGFLTNAVLNLPGSAYSVAAADVNGDGKADVVYADYYDGALTVLTNNGCGGLGSSATYQVGDQPWCVVAADVNGDGKVDLISASDNLGPTNLLTVLTNNGQGGFVLACSLPVGYTFEPGMVIADVNGDGKPDIICPIQTTSGGTLLVLTNSGLGGFAQAPSATLTTPPQSVAAADVNGDGYPDLICSVGGYVIGALIVLTNDGHAAFVQACSVPVGPGAMTVTAADVNGDGYADLIAPSYAGGYVSVALNNGHGGFVLAGTLPVGNQPYSVATADLNGDGKVDLVSANVGDSTLTVLTNNGGGGFAPALTLAVGQNPWSVAAADMNGDSRIDLICAGMGDSSLMVLTNTLILGHTNFVAGFTGNGAGLTNVPAASLTGTLPPAQLPANVITNHQSGVVLGGSFSGDGSGLTNVVAVGQGGRPVVTVDSNGTIPADQIPDIPWDKIMDLAEGDVLPEGVKDAIIGGLAGAIFSGTFNGAFSGSGSGLTDLPAANLSGTLPLRVLPNCVVTNGARGVQLTGSFAGNGAGMTNVNLMSLNSEDALGWTTNVATIWSFPTAEVLNLPAFPGLVVVADVNGDNKKDVVYTEPWQGVLKVLTNDGHGGLVSNASYQVGGEIRCLVAADVNGDGKVDLISANTNVLTVLTNSGHGAFVPAWSNTLSNNRFEPGIAVADVNGDGKPDMICPISNLGDSNLLILTNNGHGGFAQAPPASVLLVPVSVTAADVNGDGKVDLLCACPGTLDYSVQVLTNNGQGQFTLSCTVPVATAVQSVTAVDFNGDGFVDLVVPVYNTNYLQLATNDGHGGFAPAGRLSVGNVPNAVAAADLNGDGKVDLVSANLIDNTLTVLTNNGSGGFGLALTLGVGQGPCTVAAADMNGDGRIALITACDADYTLRVLTNSVTLQTNYMAAFSGNGAGLTNLSVTSLTGTLPLAQLPANVLTNNQSDVTLGGTFSGDGAGLTNLSLAQLPANVLTNNQSGVTLSGTFSGNGAGLTNLSVAQLPANVLTNNQSGVTLGGTFTGNGAGLTNLSVAQLPANVLTNNQSGVTLGGTFTGNGSGLSNVTPADGTVNSAKLAVDSASLNKVSGGLMSGSNGNVGIGTTTPQATLDVAGNIQANGKTVAVGEQSDRIVTGIVTYYSQNNGSGPGYSWNTIAMGQVQITFNPPFSGRPSITATVGLINPTDSENSHCYIAFDDAAVPQIAVRGADGLGIRRDFFFIAIGPR